MSGNKTSTGTTWVDPDDAPELTDAFFERADEYNGERVIKRGRPKAEAVRERITIRLAPDVLEQFRASAPRMANPDERRTRRLAQDAHAFGVAGVGECDWLSERSQVPTLVGCSWDRIYPGMRHF